MQRRHSLICIEQESASSTYRRGTLSPPCREDTHSSLCLEREYASSTDSRGTPSPLCIEGTLICIEKESASSTYSRGTLYSVERRRRLSSELRRSLPPLHKTEGPTLLCADKTLFHLSVNKEEGNSLLCAEKTLPPFSREGVCLLCR